LELLPFFIDSEKRLKIFVPQALEEAIVDQLPRAQTLKRCAVHFMEFPIKVEAIKAFLRGMAFLFWKTVPGGSGVHYKGNAAAGDLGVLSFNKSKIIATSGGVGL
jgi:dTDP-4-amino-4,6-dideoxygalactose transaminase